MQETIQAEGTMTPEETQAFLSEPLTRGEAVELMREFASRDALTEADSVLAFTLRIMRFLFIASGTMSGAQFDEAFKAFAEQFEHHFGDAPGHQEPAASEDPES